MHVIVIPSEAVKMTDENDLDDPEIDIGQMTELAGAHKNT